MAGVKRALRPRLPNWNIAAAIGCELRRARLQCRAGAIEHGVGLRPLHRYVVDRSLNESQQQARQAQLGLWHDAAPVPPWIWRHEHKPAPKLAQARP